MSEEFPEEPSEPPKKPIKKIDQLAIQIVAPQITSYTVDPYLAKLIILIYTAISYGDSAKKKKIETYPNIILEETRYDTTFLYHFENKRLGLSGYIGRDKNTQLIHYVIQDKARFKWAIDEGFVTPNKHGLLDVKDREFVYNQIGVFRACKNVNDFILFMSGKKGFEFKGEYITCIG